LAGPESSSPSGERDADLLAKFLDGDHDAFSALMGRHEDRIFGLCVRMLHNRSDALESTQEIFITAFRRASSFRGDSAFGTWLYRIAINHCKDVLRRHKDVLLEQEHLEIDRRPRTEGALDDIANLRLDLSRALAELPDDYREAVVMHDLGGLPYEEIATITGVPIGTVKSRISRGRRRLARSLEHEVVSDTSKDQA
jgi:RNA polymerase sigma-70 factor (ECF subfamily)